MRSTLRRRAVDPDPVFHNAGVGPASRGKGEWCAVSHRFVIRSQYIHARDSASCVPLLILVASTLLVSLLSLPLAAGAAPSAGPGDHVPGRLIVKFAGGSIPGESSEADDRLSPPFATGIARLDQLNRTYGVSTLSRLFPGSLPPEDQSQVDLSRIYVLQAPMTAPIAEMVREYSRLPEIEYAEPLPLRQAFYVPNDPRLPAQWHLWKIDARGAWDIARGDTTAIIAIIDSGVAYDHLDLAADIWINPGEDLNHNGIVDPEDFNGIDDDSNFFIDDIRGWDFVDIDSSQVWPGEDPGPPDNDPSDFSGHGTHCAGIASAATDNEIGVAGIGWRCRLMVIRAGYLSIGGLGLITHSIAGIYYAAEMGADVISMSYGGTGWSQAEQDAVTYATQNGIVCVAAAGNDNAANPHYPAALDSVVAVAATDTLDLKTDFSNYGSWIDVSSPGVKILSTEANGSYGMMQGTSMACPLVAGLAGLTGALSPSLSPEQVADRIITTADDIDSLNPGYAGLLGAGRINAGRAVDSVIRIHSYEVDDGAGNGDGRIDFDEPISLTITLVNNYQFVAGISATLSSTSPLVTITDGTSDYGFIPYQGVGDNAGDPFEFVVSQSTLPFLRIPFELLISADGWEYTQQIELPVGRGTVLVVDDDDGESQQHWYYYTTALDELGITPEVWSTDENGRVGTELSHYQAAIWYTGDADSQILTPDDQTDIAAYLDAGGNLFLTGQNIAHDLSELGGGPEFLTDYLYAAYLLDDANDGGLVGVADDPIGDSVSLVIVGSGGAGNQDSPDVIEAMPGAYPILLYDDDEPDSLGGLRYEATCKLVYFSFGFEGINDDAPGHTKRHELLARILGWFGLVKISKDDPGSFERAPRLTLGQNYPNPCSRSTTIAYTVPAGDRAAPGSSTGEAVSRVTLKIHNLLGQLVRTAVDQELPPGRYDFTWDGTDTAGRRVASGIYFYTLSVGGESLTKKMVALHAPR